MVKWLDVLELTQTLRDQIFYLSRSCPSNPPSLSCRTLILRGHSVVDGLNGVRFTFYPGIGPRRVTGVGEARDDVRRVEKLSFCRTGILPGVGRDGV